MRIELQCVSPPFVYGLLVLSRSFFVTHVFLLVVRLSFLRLRRFYFNSLRSGFLVILDCRSFLLLLSVLMLLNTSWFCGSPHHALNFTCSVVCVQPFTLLEAFGRAWYQLQSQLHCMRVYIVFASLAIVLNVHFPCSSLLLLLYLLVSFSEGRCACFDSLSLIRRWIPCSLKSRSDGCLLSAMVSRYSPGRPVTVYLVGSCLYILAGFVVFIFQYSSHLATWEIKWSQIVGLGFTVAS